MIDSTLQEPPAVVPPSLHYERDSTAELYGTRKMFKRHKVLPRPSRDRAYAAASFAYDAWPEPSSQRDLAFDPRESGSVVSTHSSHTLKHKPYRIPSGPDLPPTPPAHSRTSSGSQSVLPSSPTYVESPFESEESISTPPPATPPNQKSPPTPDVTPPQPASRPRAIRALLLSERTASNPKSTTDSRSESFKTAREDPFTSEDETDRALMQPEAPSTRTSQSTVRHVGPVEQPPQRQEPAENQRSPTESTPEDQNSTPKSKTGPLTFDGEWRMNSSRTEVVQEWDDNLQRVVRVRKRYLQTDPATPRTGGTPPVKVIEDSLVTPTNATKAVRAMDLYRDRKENHISATNTAADKDDSAPPSSPTTSLAASDLRRFSGMSIKSGVSTVVGAVIDAPVPQRRRTLRHVRKHTALRDSNPDTSPISSAPNSSAGHDESRRRPYPTERPIDGRHYSYASVATVNSMASAKARKEVVKQGGIPVVVVPDRRSSWKPREPSLRSTSSRRTKRSVSLSSAPPEPSSNEEHAPSVEARPTRSRAVPQVDSTDERTIDYPPVVPKRTSSLSAPTSRNTSRAGSLTAESLKAHNALMEAQALRKALAKAEKNQKQTNQEPETSEREDRRKLEDHERQTGPRTPEVALHPAPHIEDDYDHHRLSVDPHGDPLFGKRLSIQNTPFSLASLETCATSHEVSEALAVSIYPHQNTSVLMVDHGSSKPSNDSDLSKQSQPGRKDSASSLEQVEINPRITTTAPDSEEPVTPPQPQRQEPEDLDYSPLRNPRSAPEPPDEPPAIAFIPATPSGSTPAGERRVRMGNYFEEMEARPKRSMSLVRRALSRRRYSESAASASHRPNFRIRNLSLSKAVRKVTEPTSASKARRPELGEPPYPTVEQPPADERMLHPFWRPAHLDYESDEGDDLDDERLVDEEPYERVFRYPLVDNRPRRNFSQRFKKTFAILPAQGPQSRISHAAKNLDTDRRTIGRTPSGNLRVIRRHGSLDSLNQSRHLYDQRPYTAPDSPEPSPSFWRGYGRSRANGILERPDETPDRLDRPERRRLLPMLSSKLEELQSLPRRLSERKKEKRSQELRRKISAPKEVRDGVGDVIRRRSYRGYLEQQQQQQQPPQSDSRD